MRRNISDLWGQENQWEKINARKQSQGKYWADFNCDSAPAAVSHMMDDRSPSPLLRESLIWQLSVCPLAFTVASSLDLVSRSGLLTCLPWFNSPSLQHFAWCSFGWHWTEMCSSSFVNFMLPLGFLSSMLCYVWIDIVLAFCSVILSTVCLVFTQKHIVLIRAVE